MKIALTYDRYDDDYSPPDLSALAGTVTAADYSSGGDVLTLTYADGRKVTITLHQCRTHSCDDTCMVVEVPEQGHAFSASYGNRDYCQTCGAPREGHP